MLVSAVIQQYLEALAFEERQRRWRFGLPPEESWANCLAFLAEFYFTEVEDYQRDDEEALEERSQLLWIHYQNCAISALQYREYESARYYADKVQRFSKTCFLECRSEPTTQFIWFLANGKTADAEEMIRESVPGSPERKQLEATLAQVRVRKF